MKYERVFMINEGGTTPAWSNRDLGRVLFHCHISTEGFVERLEAANRVKLKLYWKPQSKCNCEDTDLTDLPPHS